jgi:hypothetical protein
MLLTAGFGIDRAVHFRCLARADCRHNQIGEIGVAKGSNQRNSRCTNVSIGL